IIDSRAFRAACKALINAVKIAGPVGAEELLDPSSPTIRLSTSFGEIWLAQKGYAVHVRANPDTIAALDNILADNAGFLPEAPEVVAPSAPSYPCGFRTYSHEHGGVIKIDIDEPFSFDALFDVIGTIPGVEIKTPVRVHESFGPLEMLDEYETSEGTLHM